MKLKTGSDFSVSLLAEIAASFSTSARGFSQIKSC